MSKAVTSEFVPLDSVLEDPRWTFQLSTEDWSCRGRCCGGAGSP
jgi:hypothetical protein